MVEFKVKPVPTILITVLLLTAVYRAWYFAFTKEASSSSADVTLIEEDVDGDGALPTLKSLPHTGDDILHFFKIPEADGMKVTWSHMANSKATLEKVLKDSSIIMVEADVRLRTSDNIPVMAHETEDIPSSDLTLKQWLEIVSNTATKGIKLDIKTTNALEPSLNILHDMKASLKVPVWINSDVIKGPNTQAPDVDAEIFFKLIEDIFPDLTISAGWTSEYIAEGENEHYTKVMVENMYTSCQHSSQLISFAVRASLTAKSIPNLQWLLDKSDRYSLTVWHSTEEDFPIDDLIAIRKHFKKDRVFYDLPDEMREQFSTALAKQER